MPGPMSSNCLAAEAKKRWGGAWTGVGGEGPGSGEDDGVVNPFKLLVAALGPTLVAAAAFRLF